MKLSAVTLDCADPVALAEFYRQATGWQPHPKSDAEFSGLTTPDGLFVGFQRVAGYRPPTWPDQAGVPQQSHLDFDVEDLEAAEERLLALGAVRVEHQSGEGRWRVLLDPAGHPFCLSERRAQEALSMPAVGSFRSVVVDCPDPLGLAEFYAALVGGKPEVEAEDWVVLHVPGGPRLAFNLAPDHVAPVWPSRPHDQQQFHIDVDAGSTWDEVDAAERRALALGARPVRRADEDGFRVFLDPAGHPFCLCRI